MVATTVSTYFYSQDDVDNSRSALNLCDEQTGEDFGVRVWTDEDEWSVRQSQFENRREKAHGNDCIIVGLEACRRPILHTEVGFHFMPKTEFDISDYMAVASVRRFGCDCVLLSRPARQKSRRNL